MRARFKTKRHLSKGQIAKDKKNIYKSAFRDLPDRTIYWDPMGKKSRLGPIDARSDMYKSEMNILSQFDEYQKQGFSIGDSVRMVQKQLHTGSWNLPVHFVPEIAVTNPERTPLADMLPRVAIQDDSVNVTERTAQPYDSVEWGLEDTSNDDAEYNYAEGTYTDHEYDMVGYGLATSTNDQLILAERGLRSTESEVQLNLSTAIRQAEERQIIYGQNDDLADSSGFKGLEDIQSTAYDDTTDGDSVAAADIRELIDKTEYEGANYSDLAVVTNFDIHRGLRDELEDFTWYKPSDGLELDFGFRTLEYDGVPILKSHAIPDNDTLEAGTGHTFCLSMASTYMGMLQDLTLQPVAKIGPQERVAMDAYGTLVGENPNHIQYLEQS